MKAERDGGKRIGPLNATGRDGQGVALDPQGLQEDVITVRVAEPTPHAFLIIEAARKAMYFPQATCVSVDLIATVEKTRTSPNAAGNISVAAVTMAT